MTPILLLGQAFRQPRRRLTTWSLRDELHASRDGWSAAGLRLLEIVQTDTDVEVAPHFRNPCASSTLSTASRALSRLLRSRRAVGVLVD